MANKTHRRYREIDNQETIRKTNRQTDGQTDKSKLRLQTTNYNSYNASNSVSIIILFIYLFR